MQMLLSVLGPVFVMVIAAMRLHYGAKVWIVGLVGATALVLGALGLRAGVNHACCINEEECGFVSIIAYVSMAAWMLIGIPFAIELAKERMKAKRSS